MYKVKRGLYPDLGDYMFREHGLYSGKGVVERMEREERRGCQKLDDATLRTYGGRWEERGQPRMWREAAMVLVGFLVGYLFNVRKRTDKTKV